MYVFRSSENMKILPCVIRFKKLLKLEFSHLEDYEAGTNVTAD